MRSAIPLVLVAWALLACGSDTTSGNTSQPVGGTNPKPQPPSTGPKVEEDPAPSTCTGEAGSFYALSATRLGGASEVKMCDFKGSVVMIVNGASDCGYTDQYTPLQKLYATYKDRKFVVLAFPSDSFNQERATDKEVSEVCTTEYKITFPLMTINPVKDDAAKNITAQPVYKWIYAQPGQAKQVTWNFEKFLISRTGKVVKRWDPGVDPGTDPEVEEAIKAELAVPAGRTE